MYDLIINGKKCQMLPTKTEYLGHVVEKEAIRSSDFKLKRSKPCSVKDVQSFLRLSIFLAYLKIILTLCAGFEIVSLRS